MNRSTLKDKTIARSRPDTNSTDNVTDTTYVLDMTAPHTV